MKDDFDDKERSFEPKVYWTLLEQAVRKYVIRVVGLLNFLKFKNAGTDIIGPSTKVIYTNPKFIEKYLRPGFCFQVNL